METPNSSASEMDFVQVWRGSRSANPTDHSADIFEAGEGAISEIQRLIDQLQAARDFLRAEGERLRQMNARYAHLTQTASASVGILSGRIGKWQEAEMEAAASADLSTGWPTAPTPSRVEEREHQQD